MIWWSCKCSLELPFVLHWVGWAPQTGSGTQSILWAARASPTCLWEFSAPFLANPMGLYGSLVVKKGFTLV